MKRISEIVDTEGSTVTKFYALDPSQVNNFTTSDIGTEDVSKYTLIYTSKVNKAGEEWKADETKVTKVTVKMGTTILESYETAGSKSLIITGWSSATETDTYKQMDGTLHTYPRPFKGAPNPTLTPAGQVITVTMSLLVKFQRSKLKDLLQMTQLLQMVKCTPN